MKKARAIELLKKMICDYQEGCVGGEPFYDEDVINYLFTLDFTEEELIELGFSEEAIDSANEMNLSNNYTVYKVTIEETVSQTFEIEAESMEDAEKKARKMYKAGALVVDNPVCLSAQIMTEEKNGTSATSWSEI